MLRLCSSNGSGLSFFEPELGKYMCGPCCSVGGALDR